MILRSCSFALALLATLPAGAAVLEGYVTEQQSGRPVARARITLQGLQSQSASSKPVFTDARGYFAYRSLQAGAVLLTAEKRGYASAYYGQKRWNGPGTPIVLEGESNFRVEVRLRKLGAVSGAVTDENAIGLPDVPVFAYRDAKPLRLAGRGISDDRGVFRIPSLEPGRYRVRTGPRQLEDESGLLPTYFGDTTAADGSMAVDVNLDEETTGISIRPVTGRLLRLGGRVNFAGAGTVALYSDTGRRVAPVDASGRFTFDELTPGGVQLIAEGTLAGRRQTGYASFWLTAELDDVVLVAAPSPTVQFRCDDRENGTVRARDVSLQLTRVSPPDEPRTEVVACGADASLSVGEWQIQVTTPPKYAVAEVRSQGKPMGSNSLPLNPGSLVGISVTVTAKGAGLKGSLLGPSGQPAAGALIFLNALDPAAGRVLYNKGIARTDVNGEFVFDGLPAGEIDWSVPSLAIAELEEGEKVKVVVRL